MKTKLPLLKIALTAALFTASQMQAQNLCFLPQVTYPTGSAPVGIITADFNNDGKLDLATANQATNNVSILLGTGTGTFGAATNFATAIQPYGIATGDFNNDGKLDIVTGNLDNANNYSILLGTGTGTFGATTNFIVIGKPNSVAIADINNDGNLDLAMVCQGTTNAIVVLGNGNGTFGAPAYYPVGATSPMEVALVKLNADANWDMAITCSGTDNVSILLGNNFGGFTSATTYTTGAGTGPRGLVVADFNNDGSKDIATANNTNATISILTGNGTGTFVLGSTFATGASPRGLACADFNSDGKKDLAVSNFGGASVSAYVGNGNGTFGPINTFAAGSATNALTVGDFNQDGKTDIATVNQANFTTSILINNAPTLTVSVTSSNPCVNWTTDALTGAPGGGVFSGTGVTGNNFDPSAAGVGVFNIMYTYSDMNGCTNSKTITITVGLCTGIEQTITADQIHIFPNPSQGKFKVQIDNSQNAQITIYNMIGAQVYRTDSKNSEIDLSSAPKGIYFVQVLTMDRTITKELVIQ